MGFTPVTPPVRTRADRQFIIDADTANALIAQTANNGTADKPFWVASDERFPSMKAAIAYGQKLRRDIDTHVGLENYGLKLRTRTWEDGNGAFVLAVAAVPKDADVTTVVENNADEDTNGDEDTESDEDTETETDAPQETRGGRRRK